MKNFLVAIRFLTIIPMGRRETKEEELGSSMTFFPLVGLIIGGFLVLVRFLSLQVFSLEIASCLVIVVWVLLTGCLHLDGFCDTTDGLSEGKNKEEILRIIKDLNISAKGVVAVVLLLL